MAVAVNNERQKLEEAVIAAFTRFFPEQPVAKFKLQGDEELPQRPSRFVMSRSRLTVSGWTRTWTSAPGPSSTSGWTKPLRTSVCPTG
ncbi:hypothetical protein KSX_63080 [Ktedonospora formicarum]|uniref:Uncharacterized protein n=1 Tax=Ktedonospora formicarum TaxID=2778364 RepID=A0A8J3MUF0_9CHLR|nr:hypothetical protein KSX_63080 [Ktedonospora formicarum]